MKLKRIMAIVLCFAMVLSTMNFNVFANDTTETITEANYVAQVGTEKFESVLSALTYALENKESELKLLADSREVMTVDYDLILDADLTITADTPVTAAFYNDGTNLDFAVGANGDYTLTIGENVTFDLEDRVIWLGYYNDNCTVVVDGTLTCLNLWLGTKTVVNSTGKLVSDTHELVMRRNANLVVNGGTVEASYFQFYTGHIEATNGATIISHGPVNVNGNHSYSSEGDFSLSLNNSTFNSDGVFNIVTADSWTDGAKITLANNSKINTNDTFNMTGNVNVSVDTTSFIIDNTGVLDFAPAVPTGSNSPAYTKEVDGYVRVWGEGGGNAKESFVLKLYSGETHIATTYLNDVDGIIDGDVYVTWNFFYPESTDEYWTTTWETGHPKAGAQPTKVELYIDGTLVATTDAQMNGADNVNPVVWEELGGVAPLLSGNGTEEAPYLINNIDDLKAFRDDVNEGNTYEGKYVLLTEDLDLYAVDSNNEKISFKPIGNHSDSGVFKGIFDGGNHTISNLYQSGWAFGYEWGSYGSLGLFGIVENATIKDLKITGAEVVCEGGDVSAIAGSAEGTCVFENITVADSNIATYNNGCGTIIGWSGSGDYIFNNITIDNSVTLTGLWGSFDSSIGGVVGQAEPGASYTFKSVDIACELNIFNDCTASYDYYNYRMCGMIIGRMEETVTLDGKAYPDMSKYNVNCENVKVTIGEWANYTYCEPTPEDMNGGRGMRVEPGYSYDGLPADYDHSNCVVNCRTTMPFNTLFGGKQLGVDGNDIDDLVKLGYTELTSNITVDDQAKKARCVAQIGEERYLTLQEAVIIGGNITLIANTTENITIADNATIVLDLNGNTLNGYIAPCNPASLTVKNGSIVNTDSSASAIEVNSGMLTLENVNIKSARHAVRIDGDVEAVINGGEYMLNATSGTRHAVNVSGAANVTIKAGTFIGPKGTTMDSGSAVCVQTGATVTIEGGNFSGGKNATLGVSGTMSITGGTFDQDPANYLAAEKQVVYDDVTGLYTVVGTWTVSATANADEVYADDIVTVVVKADGANYAGATWTLKYDSEKFEYQGTTSQKGIIKGYKEDETSKDAFTKDTELASYSFKALAQKSEVSGEFKIKEATVGTVAMSVNTLPTANTAEADNVTILLKDFTVTVYDKTDEDEKFITSTTYNFPYDAKEHTVSIATVPAATVYYTYKVDDGAVSEESTTAPVIKDPGTYTITYRVDVPAGYDQTATTAQTITVTIGATIPKIEVAQYVSDYKLVLVYTDVDNAHFKYGDSDVLMLDVTEAGYMYTDDDGNVDDHPYKHVYGYVVPSIMLDDTTYADNDVYKAKVEFVFGGNVTPVGEYNYNVNCSVDEVVDIADVIYTRSVYNTVDANMVESYMKRILKADVTKSKEVNNDDITDVKTAWENN